MPEPLKEFNENAQEKFDQLRTKFKLDVQKPYIKKIAKVETSKIQDMLDSGTIQNPKPYPADTIPTELYKKAKEEIEFVDNTLNFIENLQLSPQLSLAIGLIISAHKTNNKQDIAKAVAALGEYCNE